MRNRILGLLAVGFFFTGLAAEASSIAVRVGRFSLYGESALWQDNADTFDLLPRDFRALSGGVEFNLELNEFFDVAIGVDGYSRTVTTSYLDFVRDDDTEIVQDHRLTVAPITGGIRFNPVGKFRAVIPYVSGGGGLYPYEYRNEGEFIDFRTLDVFDGVLLDRGLGKGVYGAAGLEVALSRSVTVFGEYRRHWVSAKHGEDFVDFGDFDLDSSQISGGFVVRF